jgi:hypothetical protein
VGITFRFAEIAEPTEGGAPAVVKFRVVRIVEDGFVKVHHFIWVGRLHGWILSGRSTFHGRPISSRQKCHFNHLGCAERERMKCMADVPVEWVLDEAGHQLRINEPF